MAHPGGKFQTGTGGETARGVVPPPLKAKSGNKKGAAKKMLPKNVGAKSR